jgi:4-hydroxybutyryl-CoA dehydratase/vinylacetyl-CoA-Delta-isomerase
MVRIQKTCEACAIAAASRGREDPPGSGVFFPDHTFGNITKLNTAEGFYDLIKLAADIAGGLVVTMPSERDLANAETGPYIERFLAGAAGTAASRMRVTKFLQNWVAGLHGPGTWHGAGPPQTQRMSVFTAAEWGEMRELASRLAGLRKY